MSLMENVATLTGTLKFLVDISGLNKFQAALKRTEAQMRALEKQASALQTKLNKTFNVKGNTAQKAKLDAQVVRSLDKELLAETRLSKLRRQQFQTALAEQKLTFTGERNAGILQSDKLKAQAQNAVLASKQYRAQQESLKVDLQRARLQGTQEQSKIREARLADLLQKRQAATVRLQQQAAQHATTLQRAEVGLNNAREAGIRAAQRFADNRKLASVREARTATRADQSTARFAFAAEKHAAWQARQNAPKGMDLPDFAVGLGVAGTALFGLTKALGYAQQRVEQRQIAAKDSQTYGNIFSQVGGKNPENGKRAETAFAEMTEKYGITNTAETASDFRVFMLSQQAKGVAMSKSLATYETQLAAFRAAGMTKSQQDRAVVQVQQVRSLNKADTEDVRTFAEAAPLIKQAIVESWGERTKYKGDNLDGAFMKSIPDGGVTSADFEAGFARFVSQQQDSLARQMVSIDAQQTRLDNAKYLQDQEVNASPDLVKAISDRIAAERELVDALAPLKKSLMEFELGLISVNTRLIRWMIGRNDDGTTTGLEKNPNPEPGSVGAALGPRLKPAEPETEQQRLDSNTSGFSGVLHRLFSGTTKEDDKALADENRARWGGVKIPSFDYLGTQLGKLSTSGFDIDPEYHESRLPLFNAKDAMPRSDIQPTYPGQPPVQQSAPNVTTNNTTVNPGPVTITIHVPEGLDEDAVGRIADERYRDAWSKSWREADAANGSEVY